MVGCLLSVSLHCGEREKERASSVVSLRKVLILCEGLTFMASYKSNYLPKTPSPNRFTLGVGASTYELGGTIPSTALITFTIMRDDFSWLNLKIY